MAIGCEVTGQKNKAEYLSVKTCEDCEGLLGIFSVLGKLMSLEMKHVKSSQSSQVFTLSSQVHEITGSGFWAVEGRPFSIGVK
jgi:hypothetical protein